MIKLNGVKLNLRKFPNGEILINKKEFIECANIYMQTCYVDFKYENDSDLIKLMLVKSYLDNLEKENVKLRIYYMMYSRMDRVENNSPFTLKYITNFINGLGFSEVTVVEPHSDVTMALLDKAKTFEVNSKLLPVVKSKIGFNESEDFIVFPDATAEKRYGKLATKNKLTAIKHRDFETGQITDLQLVGKVERAGFKAIITDDLCSFGNTFLLSAKKLKSMGAGEIYLLISHAEDNIFKGDLLKNELIDKVFTTDTILTEQGNWENLSYSHKLEIHNIEDLFKGSFRYF